MDFIVKDSDAFFKCRKLDSYMSDHKGYIAGGVFKDIFQDQKFRDVDIFFETEKDFNDALNLYKTNENYLFVYENENAVCYKNKHSGKKLELIRTVFLSPKDMLKRFDFTIVKFAYYKEQVEDGVVWKYMYHPSFFEDLVNKKLVIDNTSSFPINTFERAFKYRSYGFGMCRESKKKLIEMLQGVNGDDISNNLYFGFD